jgi:hypothetical protein
MPFVSSFFECLTLAGRRTAAVAGPHPAHRRCDAAESGADPPASLQHLAADVQDAGAGATGGLKPAPTSLICRF